MDEKRTVTFSTETDTSQGTFVTDLLVPEEWVERPLFECPKCNQKSGTLGSNYTKYPLTGEAGGEAGDVFYYPLLCENCSHKWDVRARFDFTLTLYVDDVYVEEDVE